MTDKQFFNQMHRQRKYYDRKQRIDALECVITEKMALLEKLKKELAFWETQKSCSNCLLGDYRKAKPAENCCDYTKPPRFINGEALKTKSGTYIITLLNENNEQYTPGLSFIQEQNALEFIKKIIG